MYSNEQITQAPSEFTTRCKHCKHNSTNVVGVPQVLCTALSAEAAPPAAPLRCCCLSCAVTPPSCASASHHSGGDSGSRAVSTSQPPAVTTSVCSNCAERLPSAVTDVQPSGHVWSRQVPALIIGSMVNTCRNGATGGQGQLAPDKAPTATNPLYQIHFRPVALLHSD